MSKIFFSSDDHFFHDRIRLYANRDFSSVEEMNEVLIQNWNTNVKPNDIIYTLGDFSFGNYIQTMNVLRRLNGKHHMILGNHDQVIVKNKTDFLKSGFVQSIENYKELKWNDKFIIMFHYPILSWNKKYYGSIQLHGHCHGNTDQLNKGKCLDVGVDSKLITTEYRPYHIEEITKYLDTIPDNVVDHHQ